MTIKKKYFSCISSFIAWTLFIFYWFITIIYNSPNNPIRIYFDSVLLPFEYFAYQKWSFFAPPPKNNHRLYYKFFLGENTTESILLEVSEPILSEKKSLHPFNEDAENLDYTILSSAAMVSDQIVDHYKFNDILGIGIDESEESSLHELLSVGNNNSPPFRTLTRYAKWVAKKMN